MARPTIVLLFSGQGAQRAGMGAALFESDDAARALLAQADALLGWSLSRLLQEGPEEELTLTSRCQPALYVHGLACWNALSQRLPGLQPAAAAGLSLGEFTAHAAAGTFSFEDGLRLVSQRGVFMEQACAETEGTMAAMIGGDSESVRRLAQSCNVDIANFNAPGQIVVSGSKPAVQAAIARAKEFGVRIGRELKVAGAYHSRLMISAREGLARELSATTLHSPDFPVISNIAARPAADPTEIKRTLEEQVTGSVRWEESMRSLRDSGFNTFVECGPGAILRGLLQRIDPEARCLTIDDQSSLETAVEALTG
ncbi:MAG TPA: ACP S-malonyltransferase [Verrucomicrobiales bacterium]|nr:ACP S-malonyltransferase [Verrucomicrobiales bacterium]